MIGAIAFLLSGAIPAAPFPAGDPVISFTNRGLSFSKLCTYLSEKSGTTITAASAIKDELITLSFTNCPLSEVLQEVAHAGYLKIEKSDSGLVLAPDESAMSQAHLAAIAAKTKAIQAAQDDLKASLFGGSYDESHINDLAQQFNTIEAKIEKAQGSQETAGRDEGIKSLRQLGYQTPLGQLAIKCLVNTSSRQIANMTGSQFLYYDNEPNGAQYPLPVNLSGSALADLQNQVSLMQSAAASQTYLKKHKDIVFGSGSNQIPVRFQQTLIAQPSFIYTNDSVTCLFDSFDDKGALGQIFPLNLRLKLPNNLINPVIVPSLSLNATLHLPASVALIWQAMHPYSKTPIAASNWENSDYQTRLLHPETQDISRDVFGQLLVEWAQNSGLNVAELAQPNDFNSMSSLMVGSGSAISQSSFLTALATRTDLQIDGQSKWVTVRPVDPTLTPAIRPNFAALGAFLRQAAQSKTVDLQPLLNLFAASTNGNLNREYEGYYLALSRSEPGFNKASWCEGPGQDNDSNIFQVLSQLTSTQLQTAQNGWLSADEISAAAQATLHQIADFGGASATNYDPNFGPDHQPTGLAAVHNIFESFAMAAPNGLHGAMIHAEVVSKTVPGGASTPAVSSGSAGGGSPRVLSTLTFVLLFPNHLAVTLTAQSESPASAGS